MAIRAATSRAGMRRERMGILAMAASIAQST
jgi:hypothetical protein